MIRTRHFFLAILLSLIAAVSAQPADSPFKVGQIKANEVSPGVVEVKLTTTTLRSVPLQETVPVPTAPLLLTGKLRIGAFIETGLLGSLMEVDLNGDGQLNQIKVWETDKGLRVDGVKVETMGDGGGRQEPYRSNGKMKKYMLDPDAPEFAILSYVKPMMSLLLAHRIEEPEVLELPNPNLQLVVFEHSAPVDGPRFLPDPPNFKLTIDGKEPEEKHLLFAWEPLLFQKLNLQPRWLRAYWVAVPLDPKPGTTEHTLKVEAGLASPEIGLYAQVNYSTEKGVHIRTDRSVGLIYSRSKK